MELFDQLGDALVDLAADTAALQLTFLCCHLRPFQCESVSLLDNPIGISLWSQCDTAGWQKGVCSSLSQAVGSLNARQR